MSSKDPSFKSPLLRHPLSKRNKSLKRGMVQEACFLQPRITQLIKENQLNLIKVKRQKHDMGSKSWWKVLDKLRSFLTFALRILTAHNLWRH